MSLLDEIKNITARIRRRKPAVKKTVLYDLPYTKKHKPWESYLISSIHKKIFLAANALDFQVININSTGTVRDEVLSRIVDSELALLVADFIVFGRAYCNYSLRHINIWDVEISTEYRHKDLYNVIAIENKSFIENQRFIETVVEYERLLYEILRNATSTHFILFPNSVLATDEAIEQLREAIRRKRSAGEAGGLEVFAGDFEIKRIENLIDEYKLPELTQIVEEMLCTYYNIPKELLDTSASTYNNKKLAQSEYFSNVIIPAVDFVTTKLETELAAAPVEFRKLIRIEYDTKNVAMDFDLMEKKVGLIKALIEINNAVKSKDLEDKIAEIIKDL